MNKFALWDRVHKTKGYRFDGFVVSVFQKLDGQVRLVVENEDGLLHIFNEEQMEHEVRRGAGQVSEDAQGKGSDAAERAR